MLPVSRYILQARAGFRYLLFVLVFVALLLLVLGFMVYSRSFSDTRSFASCIRATGDVDVSCARDIAVAKLSKKKASDIVHELELTLPSRCHIFGHIIGQEAFKKNGSLQMVFDQCTPGGCFAACMHGATGEALLSVTNSSFEESEQTNLEEIIAQGPELCSERQACHALGHVLLLRTGDLPEALNACESITQQGTQTQWSCFIGVFMENNTAVMASTTPHTPTPPMLRDARNLLSPCDAVEEKYRSACFHFLFQNQFATLREQKKEYSKKGFVDTQITACHSLTRRVDRAKCAEGIGYSLFLIQNMLEARTICESSFEDEEAQASCVYGAASGSVEVGIEPKEVYRACAELSVPKTQYACYFGAINGLHIRRVPDVVATCGSDTTCRNVYADFTANPETVPVIR